MDGLFVQNNQCYIIYPRYTSADKCPALARHNEVKEGYVNIKEGYVNIAVAPS